MRYIQRQDDNQLETVDEFETYEEARIILAEYHMSDNSANYYISQRPCAEWRDDK